MTNQVNAVASIPTEAIKHCVSVGEVALTWGRWFIILAFFAALAYTAAAAISQFRAPPSGTVQKGILPDAGWLDSLKGVLQALAGLPGWVAIFLGGLALLWVARDSTDHCVAAGDTKGAKVEAPVQTDAQANRQQPQPSNASGNRT